MEQKLKWKSYYECLLLDLFRGESGLTGDSGFLGHESSEEQDLSLSVFGIGSGEDLSEDKIT